MDGGGIQILNGKEHLIPPRGPMFELAQQVARYLETDISTSGMDSSLAVRRSALTSIERAAAVLHAEADEISEVPPGYLQESIVNE